MQSATLWGARKMTDREASSLPQSYLERQGRCFFLFFFLAFFKITPLLFLDVALLCFRQNRQSSRVKKNSNYAPQHKKHNGIAQTTHFHNSSLMTGKKKKKTMAKADRSPVIFHSDPKKAQVSEKRATITFMTNTLNNQRKKKYNIIMVSQECN